MLCPAMLRSGVEWPVGWAAGLLGSRTWATPESQSNAVHRPSRPADIDAAHRPPAVPRRPGREPGKVLTVGVCGVGLAVIGLGLWVWEGAVSLSRNLKW